MGHKLTLGFVPEDIMATVFRPVLAEDKEKMPSARERKAHC